MKNFLTKAFVCAGVLASAMALSSVATFAATTVTGSTTSTAIDALESTAYDAKVVITGDNRNKTVTFGDYQLKTSDKDTGDFQSTMTGQTTKYKTIAKVGANVVQSVSGLSAGDTVIIDIQNNDKNNSYTFYCNEGDSATTASSSAKTGEYTLSSKTPTQIKCVVENSGTLYFTVNKEYLLAAVAVKAGTPTSHQYVWQINTDGLDADIASNLNLGNTDPASNSTKTLTYSGSKFITNDNFPASITVTLDADGVPTTTPGYVSFTSTQLGESGYNKYTFTVNPIASGDDSWFDTKPSYDVSGEVYNSATGEAITGLTISATNGDPNVTTGKGFKVETIYGSTDVTFSATGYATKTVTYTAATSQANVVLVPTNIDDGTTVLDPAKIYINVDDREAHTSFAGYTINGFTLSGGSMRLYYDDNATSLGYTGRFNLNSSNPSNAYITYKPESDGVITVYVANGSSDEAQAVRQFAVKADNKIVTTEILTGGNKTVHEVSFNVKSGTTYTLSNNSKGSGGSNIYKVEFVSGATAKSFAKEANDKKAIYVTGDKAYLVVGISKSDYEDTKTTAVKVLNAGGEVKATSSKVYKSVKVTDGSDTITLGADEIGSEYVFGVKVGNAGSFTLDSFKGSVTKTAE